MDTEAWADLVNESSLNTSAVAEPAFLAALAGGWLVIILLTLWSMAWKGWALWRAACNKHTAWYVALLILNTLGILEIIYIFAFSNYKTKKQISNSKTATSKK